MDSLDEIIQAKAAKLDIADKQDELSLAQQEVERIFPSGVRAMQIKDDTLIIKVSGSSLASEVRMRQMEIIDALKGSTEQAVGKVWIKQ